MPKSRISRVTTRTGDGGQTRLATGKQVPKTHPFIRALGVVDELNSAIGVLLAQGDAGQHQADLLALQQTLFDLGAFVALEGNYDAPDVAAIDAKIEALNAELEPLTEFVLPGGNPLCAHAHLCRAICRRVEVALWDCVAEDEAFQPAAQFLNRLGDLFFVLARTFAEQETQWHGPVKE